MKNNPQQRWKNDGMPRREYRGKKKDHYPAEDTVKKDYDQMQEWLRQNKPKKLPTMYVRDYRWLPFEDLADSLVDD